MPNFIKATYHTKLKVAEFIADDGRHLLRFGGTLPWRINNSGDLVSPAKGGKPAPKKTKNYVGFASVEKSDGKVLHFFMFPDYETGRRELLASLKRKHQERSIPQIIETYAPPSHNDTGKYIAAVLAKTGIPKDKLLKDFSEQELQSLVDAIETLEGYHNEKASRKEVWVPVSRVNATDGAHTLPDEELVLVIEGKERTVKSDAVGRFPPIPHADTPIEVKHRTADGNLKPVGTIQGDQGKQYNLITRVRRFFGQTAPDESTEAKQKKRHPFMYRVQPGDTLTKIAARFETTVGEIKRDNQRKTDKIFAGEELSIYSPPSGAVRPARPMPTPKRSATSASTPSAGSSAPAARPSPPAASKPAPKAPPAQAPAPSPPPKSAPPKEAVGPSPAPEGSTSKKEPPPANEADAAARTKEGSGKPLAVVEALSDRAPWMRFAVEEAKHFKGMVEDDIEKEKNYHVLVNTGQTTISNKKGGNNSAWCAAFVNWCLIKDGRSIGNPGFVETKRNRGMDPERGRANAFERLSNFVEIKKPIFGAIAIVHSGGPGQHVGFVYAKSGDRIVVLGGNQANQINFSEFTTTFSPARTKKNADGTEVKIPKRKGLRYFVPATYLRHEKDVALNDLEEKSAESLNSAFKIVVNKKNANGTR